MIIAHVRLDMITLKACSATCRSWYIATLPHLHHTLTFHAKNWDSTREGFIPLRKLGEMRLLPLIKRLQIAQSHDDPWFPPMIPNAQTLVYFSALANVRELGFDEVDLSALAPQAQQYLGHFAPTLQSLALRKPRGTHSQLLRFLGLFPNLDDFKLLCSHEHKLKPDQTPVPQSAPPLRGRLTLGQLDGDGLLRALSEMCGGLRFRHMDLSTMEGGRFLLDACAETLETLRIYPVCWSSGEISQRFQFLPV